MARFFTADPHFGLNDFMGIIDRDSRPFKKPTTMNKKIIKLWNSQAKKDDTIYVLGDFINYNKFDHSSYEICLKLVQKIKAKVILILGNNEERLIIDKFDADFNKFREHLLKIGFFDVIKDGLELEICGTRYYLNHYPAKAKKDMLNLFGHVHSCCQIKKYGLNVGVDCHYFKLLSEADVKMFEDRRQCFDENVYD